MGEKETVCVTGAGGFVASWVTKLLLSQGYKVHGTARDPCDEKNGVVLGTLRWSYRALDETLVDSVEAAGRLAYWIERMILELDLCSCII